MENTRAVYIDKALTNVFLAYKNDGFIAEELYPTLYVRDLTGIAFKLDESHLRTPRTSLRTGLARAQRITMNLTTTSYGPLLEHSLETFIPDDVMRSYQAPLVPKTSATNVVSGQLEIEKELAVRDQATTVGNYAAGHSITLSGANQWSTKTSPLEAPILAARRAVKLDSGNYPNVAVMNPDVRDALRQHSEVQARLAGAVAITNEQRDAIIRDMFKVDKLLVAEAVGSDQVDGSIADGVKGWIWNDDVVLAYVTPAPAIETLTSGYLLRLDPVNAVNGAPLVGVDEWYEQPRKSTFIRANDYYLPWTVANTAGYVFKDVLA